MLGGERALSLSFYALYEVLVLGILPLTQHDCIALTYAFVVPILDQPLDTVEKRKQISMYVFSFV